MKTPITYYGGKQKMVPAILSMMPKHKIYCEPFFGGGAVFFAKGKSFLECINDKNDILINFYHQCIENFEALQWKIQHTLCSEAEFIKARNIYNFPNGHNDIDKAWAVWVMTNMSIMATPRGGWKRDNGTGGSHIGIGLNNHRISFTSRIHERLATTQISCKDALEVIKERDTAETFFYLDPPYIGAEQKHYKGYKTEDFRQLLEILSAVKGKFILSHFSCKILEDYAKANSWNMKLIEYNSMIPALVHKPRRKIEVLVYNYSYCPGLFDNEQVFINPPYNEFKVKCCNIIEENGKMK